MLSAYMNAKERKEYKEKYGLTEARILEFLGKYGTYFPEKNGSLMIVNGEIFQFRDGKWVEALSKSYGTRTARR